MPCIAWIFQPQVVVLVALLDSHYTELAELLEKALLLYTLEQTVNKHFAIFIPKTDALEHELLCVCVCVCVRERERERERW